MTHEEDYVLKKFGDLKDGDVIFSPDGNVTVEKSFPHHIPDRMYEITTSTGAVVEASGNHLWYIETREDRWNHKNRLKETKKLLSSHKTEWIEEALFVAEHETPYEIGASDLDNFFDFITDENKRYFFIQRILLSIGHIAEEEVTLEDSFTLEQVSTGVEKLYDARRFFQQALALTGKRKFTKKWDVIVGRVVTTDDIFNKYPEAYIPDV